MKHLKLAQKNKEINPTSLDDFYERTVVQKIRTKYSLSQELAILRQRDTKPSEFAEYHAFVEACKAEVKQQMGM